MDVRKSLSVAFLAISDQYATLIFLKFLTKWLTSAILDVRISLSITFLAILDQYRFFLNFFLQNGCRWPFWMSENHFRSHFYPFHNDTQLLFFLKFLAMADVAHFGCPNFTFDRISGHFRSIRDFINFFEIFLAPLCHLAAELFKCRLVRRRRRRRRRQL